MNNAEVVPITEYQQNRPPSRKGWLWITVSLVVLAAAFLGGFLPRHARNQRIAEDVRNRKATPPIVEVTAAQRSGADLRLTLPGTITAVVEAPIFARASGYLAKRYADIGDHVRAGQLLATIDAPDLDDQVDQAKATVLQSQSVLGQTQAQLNLASVTWTRWKALTATGVVSRQEGDTQEANYEVAQANLRAAENNVAASKANLQRLLKLQNYEKVVAPFSGIVTARNVDVGSLISGTGAGQGSESGVVSTGIAQSGEMFRVAQTNRMRLFVSVPEPSAPYIKAGQNAGIRVDSLPTESLEGKVTRTANAVDPATRTLLAEVQIDNRSGKLLPGMYATLTFQDVRARPPVVVPSDALITRGQGTMVAVVRDNVVHVIPVRVGRDYGSQVEVLDGVNEGDQVVINPSDQAKDNTRVVARQADKKGSERPPAPSQRAENRERNSTVPVRQARGN